MRNIYDVVFRNYPSSGGFGRYHLECNFWWDYFSNWSRDRVKVGASTGGLDIIAMILSKIKDKPVGTYFFFFNAIIIIAAGYVYGWEKALYTLVTLYVSTRIIDAIHTRHVKITALIVTKNGADVRKAIHSRLVRGLQLYQQQVLIRMKIKKC